ncbi:MAG: hypothetical protein ACREM2_12525 [Vulcanimicrobiaceae bacterium]
MPTASGSDVAQASDAGCSRPRPATREAGTETPPRTEWDSEALGALYPPGDLGFDASSFGAHPGGEPPTDFSEFFNMFFGATGGPQGSRRSRSASTARRGEDLETTLELPLADAFRGGKKTVTLQFEDVCPKCGGSGIVGQEICPVCGGTGRTLSAKSFDVTIPRGVRSG